MPIDPSIILAGRPMPQIDLLGNVAAVQQLRGMIEAQRLNELQRQQGILSLEGQREAIARTRALNEALSANPNLTDQQLFQLGGTAAFPIVDKRNEWAKQQAETNRANVETSVKELEAAAKALDLGIKTAQTVDSQETYNAWAKRNGRFLSSNGVVVPAAYDPEWMKRTVGMGMSLKDKLDAKIREQQEARDAESFPYKLERAKNEAEASKLNEFGLTREKQADLQRAQQDRDAADARAAKNRDVQMRGQNMVDARARETKASQDKAQSAEAARTAAAAQSGSQSVEQLIKAYRDGYRTAVAGITTGANRNLVRHQENIVDAIARVRTGAALTEGEAKRFNTLSGATIADLLAGDQQSAIQGLERIKSELDGISSRIDKTRNAPAGAAPSPEPRREKWAMRDGNLVKVN